MLRYRGIERPDPTRVARRPQRRSFIFSLGACMHTPRLKIPSTRHPRSSTARTPGTAKRERREAGSRITMMSFAVLLYLSTRLRVHSNFNQRKKKKISDGTGGEMKGMRDCLIGIEGEKDVPDFFFSFPSCLRARVFDFLIPARFVDCVVCVKAGGNVPSSPLFLSSHSLGIIHPLVTQHLRPLSSTRVDEGKWKVIATAHPCPSPLLSPLSSHYLLVLQHHLGPTLKKEESSHL